MSDQPTVPFIFWKCACGAHGSCEASKPSKRYRLHRGAVKRGGLRVRPGHGLVDYKIYDQARTAEIYVEAS